MDIKNLTVDTIRFLSADTVQKANSGHPGSPMGMAPAAFALWGSAMKHNPKNPAWRNRDRFVLSSGHCSALLYSLLHLFGYGLPLEELKKFRQLDSLTPGHPEYRHTVGVETTTGPLGQGIANAVGFAIAEKHLAAVFNKPGLNIVDHYTYALCGDGCLMEGVSHEAASLAATLKLNKLIILYDSNGITIEGSTDLAFSENVQKRFAAYGFNCLEVADGSDTDAILRAIETAKTSDKPTFIEIKTIIGHGAPNKSGKAAAHGEPLGEPEIALAKEALNFKYPDSFSVPDEVYDFLSKIIEKLGADELKWNELLNEYKEKYPDAYANYEVWHSNTLPDLLNDPDFWSYEGDLATRVSSETILNKLAAKIPNLIGGSADLAPSNKSYMKGFGSFAADTPNGRNLHFGVREFAMSAIANAIALHGGLIPYVAGFFIFTDYMKPALRLSALMGLRVINILTHDSIGVGEDGPTHQPIEQLAALRSLPGFTVIRPCDTNETAAAWYIALTNNGPTALVLTRQNLPLLPETGKGALRGAYILRDSKKPVPDVLLMATGSEVALIYKAYDILQEKGIDTRVVSMPCWEIFEKQSAEYKESVLPSAVRARVAVEALSAFGWERYTGLDGKIIAMNSFGASAPFDKLYARFGFTVEAVVAAAID